MSPDQTLIPRTRFAALKRKKPSLPFSESHSGAVCEGLNGEGDVTFI